MSDIQKLAFDAANGKVREGLTKEQMNDAVRNAVIEACGGEWNVYKFMANRYGVFAIIAELMPVSMHSNLIGKFEDFAEFKDTALADKPYFVVEDDAVYPVVTCARGNQDIERNKIIDKNFTVPTIVKGIKFYEELDMFMSGKMDLSRLSEKATEAMSNYVGELISTTIYGSYSSLATRVKTTGAFDAATLNTMIEHIKASTGATSVQIFGTTSALSNIVDAFGYSDGAKDRANSWGYYGEFRGTTLIALPQAYTAGTPGTFHVDVNHIVIVPSTEKIVKVLFEGEPFVNMVDPMTRNDMQTEILFQRRIGAAAITVNEGKYGIYKFS